MKRVVAKNPELLEEMKQKTGCRNPEMKNGKACRKAEELYKRKGGKYKRVKTVKDLLLL